MSPSPPTACGPKGEEEGGGEEEGVVVVVVVRSHLGTWSFH